MRIQNISRLKYVHAHMCVCVLCVWMEMHDISRLKYVCAHVCVYVLCVWMKRTQYQHQPYHTRRYTRTPSHTYLNEGRGVIGSIEAGLCYTFP